MTAKTHKPTEQEVDEFMTEIIAMASEPIPELEFDPADLSIDIDPSDFALGDFDADTPTPSKPAPDISPTPVTSGSIKISLRVPARVLSGYKAHAAARRKPYQSLMIQALRDTLRTWEAPAVKKPTV